MNHVAEYTTSILIKNNIILLENKELYKTGITLILADVINFLIIITISFISQTLIYGFIYLLLFLTVRVFSGGFHAKTYSVCRMTFVCTYIAVLAVAYFIGDNWILYTIMCDIAALITMVFFSPVRHPNKELSDKEIKGNKAMSLLTTTVYSILSVVLVILGRKEGLIIAIVLLAITILMYIGILTNHMKGGV